MKTQSNNKYLSTIITMKPVLTTLTFPRFCTSSSPNSWPAIRNLSTLRLKICSTISCGDSGTQISMLDNRTSSGDIN
ncbi:hypothetical protein M0R45_033251 [Rubus argutus]|uniref:Uncharacterized protein n=1 Tax=Rubus argutus TaxID=59490 RepID=A0AAW1WLM2_RUBAR